MNSINLQSFTVKFVPGLTGIKAFHRNPDPLHTRVFLTLSLKLKQFLYFNPFTNQLIKKYNNVLLKMKIVEGEKSINKDSPLGRFWE